MKRQAILERLGWRFIRIRGSKYFKNPEETMKEVVEKLVSFDILPCGQDENNESADSVNDNELLKRVKKRAQEIRNKWVNKDGSNNIIENMEESEEAPNNKNENESFKYKKSVDTQLKEIKENHTLN